MSYSVYRPEILMIARTSMPQLSVATAVFQILRTLTPGRLIAPALLMRSAGSMPNNSAGAKSHTRKGELSPWLNCRYTIARMPLKAARMPYAQAVFPQTAALLLRDVYNVAHRPFRNLVSIRRRLVDNRTVEHHGGRTTTVKVVCRYAAIRLHEFRKLQQA